MTEDEACRQVAGVEFPTQCGTACNPRRCDGGFPDETPAPSAAPNGVILTRESDIYCFPPYNDRQVYENVWGKYRVEVKQGDGVCGPGDTLFSNETVSLNEGKDKLTLEFKMVNGTWMGSEVRILLPESEMPYTYGTYQFSVPTVQVLHNGGMIKSLVLPQSLVLGMFTWDPAEDFRQNWNHEVDIEISRWDGQFNADAQFLVQPPGLQQQSN